MAKAEGLGTWQKTCFLVLIMAEAELPIQPFREQRGLLRRSVDWLFSQRHFHLKVLSGTAAGVAVILALAAGALSQDWPQFRGPSASGVGDGARLEPVRAQGLLVRRRRDQGLELGLKVQTKA